MWRGPASGSGSASRLGLGSDRLLVDIADEPTIVVVATTTNPEGVATDRLEVHRVALLARHRCSACAEHRPTRELLAGEDCPHCGAPGVTSTMPLERRLELALGPARSRRLVGYVAVGVAAVVAGWMPLLATLTTLVAMVVMRRAITRGASAWLSPKRRAVTKLLLRQWLVIAALGMLLLDEIATLLPIPGWPVRVVSAIAAAALYVEISLVILRDRLARDQRSAELQLGEWLLPALATLAMLGAAVGAAAALIVAYEVIVQSFGFVAGMLGVG